MAGRAETNVVAFFSGGEAATGFLGGGGSSVSCSDCEDIAIQAVPERTATAMSVQRCAFFILLFHLLAVLAGSGETSFNIVVDNTNPLRATTERNASSRTKRDNPKRRQIVPQGNRLAGRIATTVEPMGSL